MRKILAFLSIGIIWCFLPMLVKASNEMTLDELKAWYASQGLVGIDSHIQTIYNYNNGNLNNYDYGLIVSETDTTGNNNNVVIFKCNFPSDTYDLIYANNPPYWNLIFNNSYSIAYSYCEIPMRYNFDTKTLVVADNGSQSTAGYVYSFNTGTNQNKPLLKLASDAPDINFEEIYYSPQIPVPSIDVYMGSDVNNPTSGQAVWNASMEFGDNSQYYIQYGYKASFPSYIDVGLASLRGDFSYNYYNYTSTNYIDIVPLNSLTSAVNQSKPASYFQSAWQTFYDDYLTQSLLPQFGTQVNAMSSAMLDNAKDYYVDYMLGQIPMYGNRLEIFARYFIIDEENNNRVVVGAWNHWSSKDGSRTKERPSNYIDNVALPGYINTSNDVDYQDNTGSFDSVGNTTGVPATIINNNYVPNYPDYPTIASYNKDNLLVSSIDKLNEVKGFFGEFNDFLNVTFVWVPDWIWALIGIGFSLSIIVFFLRML